MADQIITNEVPSTNTQWYLAFRLVEQMVLAGWTVVESSKGSGDTPAASDRWSGDFGNLVADAWIILEENGGQQILFRRGTSSSTGDGWIIWSEAGGFTTGGTDVAPANIPADAAPIRGTHVTGTPGSFTTDGPWFGATSANTFDRLNIGCRDATGIGDSSFWLIAKQTAVAYTSTTANAHGRIAFEALAGTEAGDTLPYAWWIPTSLTGAWAEGMDDIQCIGQYNSSAGTTGRWRRWWNHGQGSSSFEQYGTGIITGQFSTSLPALDSNSIEASNDKMIYTATPVQIIHRLHLTNNDLVAKKDPNGGYTSNIFITQPTDVPNLSTLATGDYAKFGNYVTVWWDGNAGNPPLE